MVDNVLVHGRTQEGHGQCLDAALARISNAGVTLDAEKCELSQGRVKFLGHIVDGSGIQSDPEKVQAIQATKKPTNTSEVRHFLGMINQLAKFAPSLAEKAKPIRVSSASRMHGSGAKANNVPSRRSSRSSALSNLSPL